MKVCILVGHLCLAQKQAMFASCSIQAVVLVHTNPFYCMCWDVGVGLLVTGMT
jgi:hypothetical protein